MNKRNSINDPVAREASADVAADYRTVSSLSSLINRRSPGRSVSQAVNLDVTGTRIASCDANGLCLALNNDWRAEQLAVKIAGRTSSWASSVQHRSAGVKLDAARRARDASSRASSLVREIQLNRKKVVAVSRAAEKYRLDLQQLARQFCGLVTGHGLIGQIHVIYLVSSGRAVKRSTFSGMVGDRFTARTLVKHLPPRYRLVRTPRSDYFYREGNQEIKVEVVPCHSPQPDSGFGKLDLHHVEYLHGVNAARRGLPMRGEPDYQSGYLAFKRANGGLPRGRSVSLVSALMKIFGGTINQFVHSGR